MSERKAWIIPFLFVVAVIAIIWVCILVITMWMVLPSVLSLKLIY